jgi:integrase
MARTVRDASLETRAARGRLKPRPKPYFRFLEEGLHLGYRKPKGRRGGRPAASKWVERFYIGQQKYETEVIGEADDYSDADGEKILNYAQAQAKARQRRKERTQGATDGSLLTVGQAVEAYISERDARETRRRGRPTRSDAHRLARYVIGHEQGGKRKAIAPAKLANTPLHALAEEDLSKWRTGLPEAMTLASKQRTTNDLKAALFAAYEANRRRLNSTLPAIIRHGLKAPNGHDEEAPPLARDNQILTDVQVGRLIQAAREVDNEQGWDGDLFQMTVVLAATGARFSQVARMRVGDCQAAKNRLLVPKSRKGKGKVGSTSVPIGKDVLTALQPAVTGRASDEWLLQRWRYRQVTTGNKWERAGRGAWQYSSEFSCPWHVIRRRAKMPDVIPYAFRHSSIVRGIRANLPIRLVAAMHDTSVGMIEQHYAKWVVDGLEELAARAVVPLVPEKDGGKVVPMPGRPR